jgi:hypothetical protein
MQVSAYNFSDSRKFYSPVRPESSQSSQKTSQSSQKADTQPSLNSDSKAKAAEIDQQRYLQELKSVDRAVRAHELAHLSVGGRYVTSGANYQYERGPDGMNYAVAGEVSIDTSEIPGDPQATLAKQLIVLRAALAPANPSAQDRRVAAQAVSKIQQARVDLLLQTRTQQQSHLGSQLDAFA